jgi:hypothetical protein
VSELEGHVSDQKTLNFRVKGQDPLKAGPPLYGNFLACSQVGTDVEFEFIFLDLNQVAHLIQELKASEVTFVPEVEGKTVVKVVMPAASFVQLREQFDKIFAALQGMAPAVPEVDNEQRNSSSKMG